MKLVGQYLGSRVYQVPNKEARLDIPEEQILIGDVVIEEDAQEYYVCVHKFIVDEDGCWAKISPIIYQPIEIPED